jgi:hypothetical protein
MERTLNKKSLALTGGAIPGFPFGDWVKQGEYPVLGIQSSD